MADVPGDAVSAGGVGPERLIRPEVLAMRAYAVAPAEGLIKLDAMENPYRWPAALRQPWLDALATTDINRYPDASGAALKAELARVFGIPDSAGLLLGNGSDELIQLLALAFGGRDGGVLSPGPSFVMYRLIAGLVGMPYHEVPLRASDFGLDVEGMLAAIRRERPAIVYLAWPNNPTGTLYPREAVEAVLAAAPGVVVVDEAYHAFCAQSFLDRVADWPNLLVMRTLSKAGLAGLRLGFLVGAPRWMEQLEKCRLPYNVNALTQVSTRLALQHWALFTEQTESIRAQRAVLEAALQAIAGVRVWPSMANFLTFRVGEGMAASVHARLINAGVLIKRLDGSHPLLRDCLRVTVGTPAENQAFLQALAAALVQDAG
jgi:histidinol-phosphate aminotransferase